MFSFKKVFVPTEERKAITALETWTVRWYGRVGSYSSDVRKECEVFMTEEDAKEYAQRIRDAFKLTRNFSNNYVEVEKNSQETK